LVSLDEISRSESIAEQINNVNNNKYLEKCLKLSNHKRKPESAQEEIQSILAKNYTKNPDGTFEMINKVHLKKQKQVLGFLMKQFGSNLFLGKPINGVSLPVTIFEPRSILERQANSFMYAPHFLGLGGQTPSSLEQFKMVVAYFISSLHTQINPQKPFNPILGETFQGMIDNCPIYAEQISHHPPITAFQMVGENFTIHGNLEFTATISFNTVKSRKVGFLTTTFKNSNSVIIGQYPSAVMHGTAMGKRTFEFSDKVYLFDIGNKYYAEINFGSANLHYSKGKQKHHKDNFSGFIWSINDVFVRKLQENVRTDREITLKFKEKDHAFSKIATIEGSWLEYLKIDNRIIWKYGTYWPSKLQYAENALPSDSNYRLDILYLRAEDEEKSQKAKQNLEEYQRRDRKLRLQMKSKFKK